MAIFALTVIPILVLVAVGAWQYKNQTKALAHKLSDASTTKDRPALGPGTLPELPKPVERYFRNVLADHQTM